MSFIDESTLSSLFLQDVAMNEEERLEYLLEETEPTRGEAVDVQLDASEVAPPKVEKPEKKAVRDLIR